MVESWVFGANDPELGFGLNHLPFTAFVDETTRQRRLGVGIGACVLDLSIASPALPASVRQVVFDSHLNALMSLGSDRWAELRQALQFLLSRDNRDRRLLESALLPTRRLELQIPCTIGDYTDFYAARDHARRVGELFRPDKPLLENYDWVPIAYHGRASSIVPSGAQVRRPPGQMRGDGRPSFGPTQRLDYELELGYFVGTGNALGESIPIGTAEQHLFGVSLLNDWSARDIQAWESQPLGPFLGKNFCSTLSPWITPMAALEPFRVRAVAHDSGLLDYLDGGNGVSLRVEARLSTERSRAVGLPEFPISATDSACLYWTPEQMVAHHTSGGCNLRPGDLLGSGTVSGASRDEAGCLLELTALEPLMLSNGETRKFLEDGDEVTLVGWGEAAGEMPIRLGECRGRVSACTASQLN
jgi:fumarylacetoacetase